MPRRPRATLAVLLLTCFSTRTLAQDNRLLTKLPGPSGTAVEFSRDGKLILTAGGDQARVWDAETFKPVTGPLVQEGGVQLFSASLCPDGSKVLTVVGGRARVWDMATGRPLHTRQHPPLIRSAAFSPKGSEVLTAGDDKAVRLWDAASGLLLATLNHADPVVYAAFSPDCSKVLALCQWRPGPGPRQVPGRAVRLWDARNEKKLWAKEAEVIPFQPGHPTLGRLRHPVAFSPDGRKLALICRREAHVYETTTGRLQAWADPVDEGGHPRALTFSADGRKLLTATSDGAQVWDLSANHKLVSRTPDHGWIEDAVFSPDGRFVLFAVNSGILSVGDDELGAGVWDAATGKPVFGVPYPRHRTDDRIPAVAFSPDGRRVAAGFPSDGFTAVWAVEAPKKERPTK